MGRIHKQYETIVNLSPVENYSSNSDLVIINKLRKVFEGKCYKSSLICKIIRIVRRGWIKPAQNLTDGSSDVNVTFEAESIIYNENDIITDCVVKNVERSGELICKSEYAAIHIRGNVMLRGIQTGQIIPVRVVSVRYSVGKDNITINGTPYFHPMTFFLYKTDITPGKVPTEVIELLRSLHTKAQEAENRFGDLDPKLRKFFTETFYPFIESAEKFEATSEKGIQKLNIMNEVKKYVEAGFDNAKTEETPVFVIRHPRIDKSSPTIYHMDESIFKNDVSKIAILDAKRFLIQAVHESYASILVNYLEEYISYLNMICEMISTYDTEEKRQAHKNVWAIYNKLKQ
jgi:hypothetical protein